MTLSSTPWQNVNGYIKCSAGYNVCSINAAKTTEGLANAALIEAAPELLEEHQRTLKWLIHIKGQVKAHSSVMLGFDQAIRSTQKVIDQAKGFK